MNCFLGVDAGTSGIKALVINEVGEVKGVGYRECDLITPKPGWVEQNPLDWWKACDGAVMDAVAKSGCGKDIRAIGFSGQMQGPVMMDGARNPIGNCLIWMDQRAGEEVLEMEKRMTGKEMLDITASYCLNSYWVPKLLWLQKHRPEEFNRTRQILFTKDYLRFMMTGEYATEVSDASLTFLMDVPGRKWSEKMFQITGIPKHLVPERLLESREIAGYLKGELADKWGMKEGIPVVAGGGDQTACGVGSGIVEPGTIGSSIGTSGVVFGCSDRPFIDEKRRATFSMCHSVPHTWGFLGLSLTSGASFKWLRDTIFAGKKAELQAAGGDIYDYMTDLASKAQPGSEGLTFLPYFNGEKTPHNDERARATLFGMSYRHGLNEICRSFMEGVTYSLRDTVEICRELGMNVRQVRASGGGAKSGLWRQIQADIYNAEVVTMNLEEGPAAGAAILAAVGAGYFKTEKEGCDAILSIKSITEPVKEHVKIYEDYYQTYRKLYPALRDCFKQQADVVEKHTSFR